MASSKPLALLWLSKPIAEDKTGVIIADNDDFQIDTGANKSHSTTVMYVDQVTLD